MKSFEIKSILMPTDFSKTSLLAIEHAAFMARLFKANLFLLHVIEIADTTYNVVDPGLVLKDFSEIEKIVTSQMDELSNKIKLEYEITITPLCSRGKTASEIVTAVRENDIDLVIMGTHGASGFDEFFMGSNAHKTVTVCPCPVITIQAHSTKVGFANIVMPIDDSLPSRQKVDYTITLAKEFGSKIHILGLLDESWGAELGKFEIKIESIEAAVKDAGLAYELIIIKGDNLAAEAMNYSKKIDADLIVVLTDHESKLTGMFLGAFAKQIVNHSRIPVMSIRPIEGIYEPLSLAAGTGTF